MPSLDGQRTASNCRVAVLWIDWYPYHVARFRGLLSAPSLADGVVGVEMVGGVGVHSGLKFRQSLPSELPIVTLLPESNWASVNKLELAKLVWRKLDELNPDTVLVPGYYTLPGIAAAVWARMRQRTSVLMTESAAYDHPRSGWKELFKGWLLRALFQWAVVGGKDHVAYLHQLHFPADRITGFYDVVDNAFFEKGTAALRQASSAAENGLPNGYFLYVGRLAPEKNVRGLFASWLIYRSAGGTLPLVLAGDGPERITLEQLCAQSTFGGDVIFTGLRNSEELLPLYAFASCFVIASTREPWGLVVNEAMAAGLPVIVTDRCGCAADLVRNTGTGYIVSAGNERSLAHAMHRIANLDEEERHAMGRAAQERIRIYSPERFGLSVAGIVDATSRTHAQQHVARQSR